jgi:hypothetical protein
VAGAYGGGNAHWYGSALSQLYHPTGLALVGTTLFISDYQNSRVMRYEEGATEGEIVAGFWGAGAQDYQVYYASGVAAAGDPPTVYVSDYHHHRVQKWSPTIPASVPNYMSKGYSASKAAVVFGGHGASVERNALYQPHGLARAYGVSFVCDTENARVVAFADGASSGTIIAGGFGPGNGVGQLNKPWDIVVLSTDVLISDRNNHRIVKVAQDGSGRYTASVVHGSYGTETSQLSYPTGLVMESGDLLVSDSYNHRVMRVTLPAGGDESSAVVIAGGNGMGIGYEQLKYPEGLAVYGGAVYVCDRSNFRVMKWAFGATTGAVAAGFNGNGIALHQLSNPYGIDVADGVIYVADSSNDRVVAWEDGATSGATVTGFGKSYTYGTGENQLNNPMA